MTRSIMLAVVTLALAALILTSPRPDARAAVKRPNPTVTFENEGVINEARVRISHFLVWLGGTCGGGSPTHPEIIMPGTIAMPGGAVRVTSAWNCPADYDTIEVYIDDEHVESIPGPHLPDDPGSFESLPTPTPGLLRIEGHCGTDIHFIEWAF